MTYLAGTFQSAELWSNLVAPATLLISPVAVALWFRHAAYERPEEQRAAVWLGHLRLSRFIMAATLAGWWALWDSNRLAVLLPALAGLHQISAAPARCDKLTETFLTHPSLARRTAAIGRAGGIPEGPVAEILKHAGILVDDQVRA